MTARAARRQDSTEAIGLIWRADQVDPLRAAGVTQLAAMCGKSYDAALKSGLPLAGPPFWTLLDEADHAAIDAAGEAMAARWSEATSGVLFARAPAGVIDAPAVWAIGRELAYGERLLPRLLKSLQGSQIRAIGPALDAPGLRFDIGTALALEACGVAGQVDLLPPIPSRAPNEPASLPSAWQTPEGDWTAFLATGVGFLADRLREAAARSKALYVFLDPVESGQIETIRNWAATQPHVRIVPLYGRNFQDDLSKGRDAAAWLRATVDSHLVGTDPLKRLGPMLIDRFWPRHAALAARFERVFARPPVAAYCSDYRSAESAIFAALAADSGAALTILPHSGWPLPEWLEVRPDSTNRQSFYMTRSGARVGAARDAALKCDIPAGRIAPPDSLRPGLPRRLIRLARRMVRLVRPKPKVVIGVVPSLGERHVSSDIPYSIFRSRIEALVNPPPDLADRVEIHFRWRWDEGGRSMTEQAGDGVQVRLETQSDRALSHFIRDCDLMIEVGLPTSCHQEAFAQACAFFRLGEPSALRPRFAHSGGTVPELSEPDPWPGLAPYVRHPLKRGWLGLKQFWNLERETAPGLVRSGKR